MSNTSINKSVFCGALREVDWELLTDKDKLGEWYHPALDSLSADTEYSLVKSEGAGEKTPLITGRVLEFEPPTKLVTTFVIGPFQGKETTITWVLEEVAGGTKLALTHEGIAEASGGAALDLMMALDKGWDEHFATLRVAVN